MRGDWRSRHERTGVALGRWDVVVVGAGSAGMTAAIAAARSGARTLLVERYGFPGGISTQVLDTFYGFYTPGTRSERVVGGIPWEIASALIANGDALERPNSYGAGTGVTYDPDALKLLWERVAIDAGVDLLYHALLVDAQPEGSRLVRDRGRNQSRPRPNRGERLRRR